MTHMPNYGFDRLSPYAFESVAKMLKCWTNLDLRTEEPETLAEIYFSMFPEEAKPIWGVRKKRVTVNVTSKLCWGKMI